MQGRVVSLDRGYPLVRTREGERRAEHAIDLVKKSDKRAAVGDFVLLSHEPGQDMLLITAIQERSSTLARCELVESVHEGAGKTKQQVLAANFDFVAIVQSLGKKPLDLNYLERQLVLAHQSQQEVVVVLTKADLARNAQEDYQAATQVAPHSSIIMRAKDDDINELVDLFSPERIGVLLGRSGVGKSTLVNSLCGKEVQMIGAVRKKDNAGRHTTVARRMVDLPGGGAVIDTPGMRALGVLGAEEGLRDTFPEISAAAATCKYRDCTHTHEPTCGVIAAVQQGKIAQRRLDSYCVLAQEVFD